MTEWITTKEASILIGKEVSNVRKIVKKCQLAQKDKNIICYDYVKENGNNVMIINKDALLSYMDKRKELHTQPKIETVPTTFEEEDFLGDIHGRKAIKRPLPSKGTAKYYLITAAQNNTRVNEDFFKNLLAVKEHFNAELLVSRLVYNKNSLNTSREKDSVIDENDGQPRYASCLNAYLNDDYLELANDLVYLGHTNKQITSSNPLASKKHDGFEKSFILPHTKRALKSYPLSYQKSLNFNKKIGYTTGVVTNINYIQGDVGQKAEIYHTYGACLVKVNDDGTSFCYQIVASNDGTYSICIFDLMFINGVVLTEQSIEAIVFGDTHHSKLKNTFVYEHFFGDNNMFKGLHFKNIILHDTLDFSSRSHHNEKNPLKRFEQFYENSDDVFLELIDTVNILNQISKLGDIVHNIESNHNNHLSLYLNGNWKLDDHRNSIFNLYSSAFQRQQIVVNKDLDDSFIKNCKYDPINQISRDLKGFDGDIYEFLSRKAIGLNNNIKFVDAKKDLRIKGVLCSLHGDKGVNGVRDGMSLHRLPEPILIGHGHGAFVMDFLHRVGFTGVKEAFEDYATTANSWTVSFATINVNGTITDYFYQNGNFR